MGLVGEFRAFLTKGNVIDLAVAFVMGMAFNMVVTSMVSGLVTPLIGVAGHFDFSAWTYTINGSTFMPGTFVNAIINFIIIGLVIFFLVVKPAERFKKKEDATTKECPQCLSQIPLKAKRCAYCTSRVA